MSKFCFSDRFTTTSGDALPGYIVRCLDKDTGAVVPIYSDENGTAIADNEVVQDSLGNYTFFVDYGIYSIECLDPNSRARFGFRRYVNMDGNDATLRDELPLSTGAGMIGTTTTGKTVQDLLDALGVNKVYSSLYPTINAAIAAWMLRGGELCINQDATMALPFRSSDGSLLADKSYKISTDGARKITYNGPAYYFAIRLFSAVGKAKLEINGDLTVDCQNLCGIGAWIDYQLVTGTDRRNCTVDGLKAINCKMLSGTSTIDGTSLSSSGSAGIKLSGGFETLTFCNFEVDTIGRAAGTGVAGSKGSTGWMIFGNAANTANAKRIMVYGGKTKNVTTDDTVGSADYTDCDGGLVFQYAVGERVTPAVFQDLEFENCVGRALKFYCTQALNGGLAQRINVIRSVQGPPTGGIDIDFQHGYGTIRDINFVYSGSANAGAIPLTPIGMTSSGTLSFGPGVVDNIRMDDTTGVAKYQIVSMQFGSNATVERQISITRIEDTGSAACLSRIGSLGLYARHDLILDNLDLNLTSALFQSDSAQTFLYVRARNCRQRSGTDVPVQRTYAGSMRVADWGFYWHDGPCPGFARYIGTHHANALFTNGFCGPGGGVEATPVTGSSYVRGRVCFPARSIASGATTRWPPTGGHNPGSSNYTGQINNVTYGTSAAGVINFTKATGSTNFTTVNSANVGVMVLVNGGAGTGAGTNIEFYIDASTGELIGENRSASTVTIQFTANA